MVNGSARSIGSGSVASLEEGGVVREAYARGEAIIDGVSCHPGIEYRDGDDVATIRDDAQWFAKRALLCCGSNHEALVDYVEKRIKTIYPGRAYFIETEENGKGVQVFDPGDFVKERCRCNKDHQSKYEDKDE